MFSEEAPAKFKQIAESMLTMASFVQEEYVTGEWCPPTGRMRT